MLENETIEQEVTIDDNEPKVYNIRRTGSEEVINPYIPEENPKVEEAVSEPIVESKVVEEVPIVENEKVVEPTTEKVVDFDPYEKLGFTDPEQKAYLEKFAEAVKANKVEEFLKVTTTNYDNMSEVELLQVMLKKEHPNATEKQLELLMRKELQSYNINGVDDEEDADGIELLKLKTDKVREELKSEQKAYKPVAYEAKSNEPSKEELALRQSYLEMVDKNPDLAEIERTKAIKFGDFVSEIPNGVNIKEQAKDINLFLSKFDKADGTVDLAKFAKVAAFTENPDKFIQDAINYGKSIKEKEHFDSLRGIDKGANNTLDNVDGEPVVTNVRWT